MLVDENEELYGTVSADCLEEDLKYYAKEVIEKNLHRSYCMIYDQQITLIGEQEQAVMEL